MRLRYHKVGDQLELATDAFYFQQGHAQYYEPARAGEFRVGGDGEMILTRLLDEHGQPLGPDPPGSWPFAND